MRFSSLSFFNFIFIRALSSNSRDDDDTPVGLGGGAASSSLEESNLELCFAGIATGRLLILNPPIGGFGVTIGGLTTITGGLATGACIPGLPADAADTGGLAGTTEFALGVAPPAFAFTAAPPVAAIFARCANGTSSSSLESSFFICAAGFTVKPDDTFVVVVVVVCIIIGRCADGAFDPCIGRSCACDGGGLLTTAAVATAARCARGTSSSSLELFSVGIVVVVVGSSRVADSRRASRAPGVYKSLNPKVGVVLSNKWSID
jgi:hypothetical protein